MVWNSTRNSRLARVEAQVQVVAPPPPDREIEREMAWASFAAAACVRALQLGPGESLESLADRLLAFPAEEHAAILADARGMIHRTTGGAKLQPELLALDQIIEEVRPLLHKRLG